MRIFFIGQKGIPASYGGVEHHVEQLATRLAKRKHEVFVYARPWYQKINTPNNNLPTNYKNVNIITLPSFQTKNFDAISGTLVNTLHVLSQKTDIIHYQGIGPSSLLFLPRIIKIKSKIVATFHCKDYEHQKWSTFARSYLQFGEKVSVYLPHGTIAVSRTIQKYIQQKYHKESLYIPNGVPLFNKKQDKTTLEDWGLEKDKYILTVARLVKHKKIDNLIKAYLKIYPKANQAHPKLVIVGGSADGTGQYENYLKKLAQANTDIIMTGYQHGKPLEVLFSNTYMYVHPSIAEGLPIAILEAMAYGKCCLVSNIPENLEPIADFGFSFKADSIKDLSHHLESLLNKPEIVKHTGEQARIHVRKQYSWDDITEKTDEFYDNLYHHHPLSLNPKDFTVSHWDTITDMTEEFYEHIYSL